MNKLKELTQNYYEAMNAEEAKLVRLLRSTVSRSR